jgi:hypothetical protein
MKVSNGRRVDRETEKNKNNDNGDKKNSEIKEIIKIKKKEIITGRTEIVKKINNMINIKKTVMRNKKIFIKINQGQKIKCMINKNIESIKHFLTRAHIKVTNGKIA